MIFRNVGMFFKKLNILGNMFTFFLRVKCIFI